MAGLSRPRRGDIPLASRIVGLCDVFDALVHERPYKSAWPVDLAVDEIDRAAVLHFDPAVVDAFASSNRGSRQPGGIRPGTGGWGDRRWSSGSRCPRSAGDVLRRQAAGRALGAL